MNYKSVKNQGRPMGPQGSPGDDTIIDDGIYDFFQSGESGNDVEFQETPLLTIKRATDIIASIESNQNIAPTDIYDPFRDLIDELREIKKVQRDSTYIDDIFMSLISAPLKKAIRFITDPDFAKDLSGEINKIVGYAKFKKLYTPVCEFKEIRGLLRAKADELKKTLTGTAEISESVQSATEQASVIVEQMDMSGLPRPKQIDPDQRRNQNICTEAKFCTIDNPDVSEISPYLVYIPSEFDTKKSISLCEYMIEEDLRALTGMNDSTELDRQIRDSAYKLMMKRIVKSYTYLKNAYGPSELSEYMWEKYKKLNRGINKLIKERRKITRIAFDSSPGAVMYGRKSVQKVAVGADDAYPVYASETETLEALKNWYSNDLNSINRMPEKTMNEIEAKWAQADKVSKRLMRTYKITPSPECKNSLLRKYNEVQELKEALSSILKKRREDQEAFDKGMDLYILPDPAKLKKQGRIKRWFKKAVFGVMGLFGLINSSDNTSDVSAEQQALDELQAQEEKVYLMPLESETEEMAVIETKDNVKVIYEDETMSIEEDVSEETEEDEDATETIDVEGKRFYDIVGDSDSKGLYDVWNIDEIKKSRPELRKFDRVDMMVIIADYNGMDSLSLTGQEEMALPTLEQFFDRYLSDDYPEVYRRIRVKNENDTEETEGNLVSNTWEKIDQTWEDMLNN
ncbi:hypothetical protein GF354_02990 [Candidatus Peregrinibacteria bacterium]|nr:hypothetical protein [Candidatus Peregrinibacteria bacterium]